MLKWHFAVLYLWRLWHWSTAEWDTWKEKVGGANSDDVSTNYKQTPKLAAAKQAADRTQTTAVELCVISSVSAPSPVPSQDSRLTIIPAVTTAMQQPLCTRRWVLHLPAQTHSMCRMQQHQPPSASHTPTHPPSQAHKRHRLTVTPAPTPVVTPGHQRGRKAFRFCYPQKRGGRTGDYNSPI